MRKVTNYIFEKFTEESDAISDMNIGQNHFKEEIMKMLPVKYVHMGVDYIDYIHYVLFGDETTVEKDKDFILGNTIYIIICKEYSKNKFFEEIMHLIEAHGFVNDKGVPIDEVKGKGNRLTITMNDAEKPMPQNEAFTEESDPISDMDIGIVTAFKKWKKELMDRPNNAWRFLNWTDALNAVTYHGKTEFIDYILKHKADIHDQNEQPLRSAAYKRHIDTGVKLVQKGANMRIAKNFCMGHNHHDTLIGLRKIQNALQDDYNN